VSSLNEPPAGDRPPSDKPASERSVYERALVDPPAQVVRDGEFMLGCFSGPVADVNVMDVDHPYHYPVPRLVKEFRCKEWRAFQLGDRRWFFFSALYEAKSFGLAIFSAWDRERQKAYEIRRMVPFGAFGIGPVLDGSTSGFRTPNEAISYRFDLSGGTMTVEASSRKSRTGPGFAGAFTLACGPRQAAMSSVCLPLGLNRAMYSLKAMMPMQGWFEAEGQRFEFDQAGSIGVLDDHKGFYPYRMRYDWVTGFGMDAKGRRVGFNLTDNQVRDQESYNENVLWINSRVLPLPPVKVTRPQGVDGVWHVQDTRGLVDLAFRPERKNRIAVNMIVLASDYDGPYGSFEGVLRSADGGEKVDASQLYGMGEKKYLRA